MCTSFNMRSYTDAGKEICVLPDTELNLLSCTMCMKVRPILSVCHPHCMAFTSLLLHWLKYRNIKFWDLII